jgi:hypothetical protein
MVYNSKMETNRLHLSSNLLETSTQLIIELRLYGKLDMTQLQTVLPSIATIW